MSLKAGFWPRRCSKVCKNGTGSKCRNLYAHTLIQRKRKQGWVIPGNGSLVVVAWWYLGRRGTRRTMKNTWPESRRQSLHLIWDFGFTQPHIYPSLLKRRLKTITKRSHSSHVHCNCFLLLIGRRCDCSASTSSESEGRGAARQIWGHLQLSLLSLFENSFACFSLFGGHVGRLGGALKQLALAQHFGEILPWPFWVKLLLCCCWCCFWFDLHHVNCRKLILVNFMMLKAEMESYESWAMSLELVDLDHKLICTTVCCICIYI